jgi:hypothetical protein
MHFEQNGKVIAFHNHYHERVSRGFKQIEK